MLRRKASGIKSWIPSCQASGPGSHKAVKTYIFQTRFPGFANATRREVNKATLEKARNVRGSDLSSSSRALTPAQVEERRRRSKRGFADTLGAITGAYFDRKLAKRRSGNATRKRIENNLPDLD